MDYRAIIQCKEPVAAGFSCNTKNVRDFTYSGLGDDEPVTVKRVQRAFNEGLIKMTCDQCFAKSKNWKVLDVYELQKELPLGVGD